MIIKDDDFVIGFQDQLLLKISADLSLAVAGHKLSESLIAVADSCLQFQPSQLNRELLGVPNLKFANGVLAVCIG